jgi:ribosomal protein S4
MAKIIKALRLIRLIRIIKLYKYIVQARDKKENEDLQSKKKRKRKQVKVQEEKKEEEEETLFKKETDPGKLGKALSESINKKTIIGTLLMLMILPLLSRSATDYSQHYSLREVFWFGGSGCAGGNTEKSGQEGE